MADEEKKAKEILLIEDDEFLRDLLTQKLQAKGFTVTVARDGESALALVSMHIPDLILLDLFLPGMSGYETVAKLRQTEATAKIPFMVLSNSAEEQSRKEAQALRAERYLVKAQSTPMDIVETVETWFSAR